MLHRPLRSRRVRLGLLVVVAQAVEIAAAALPTPSAIRQYAPPPQAVAQIMWPADLELPPADAVPADYGLLVIALESPHREDGPEGLYLWNAAPAADCPADLLGTGVAIGDGWVLAGPAAAEWLAEDAHRRLEFASQGTLHSIWGGVEPLWTLDWTNGHLIRVDDPTVDPLSPRFGFDVELTATGNVFGVHTYGLPMWLCVSTGSKWVQLHRPSRAPVWRHPPGQSYSGAEWHAHDAGYEPPIPPGFQICSRDVRTYEEHTLGRPPDYLTWSSGLTDYRGTVGQRLSWPFLGQVSCAPGDRSRATTSVRQTSVTHFGWTVGIVDEIRWSTDVTQTLEQLKEAWMEVNCCQAAEPDGDVVQTCTQHSYQGIWHHTLTYWANFMGTGWSGPGEVPREFHTFRFATMKACDECACPAAPSPARR